MSYKLKTAFYREYRRAFFAIPLLAVSILPLAITLVAAGQGITRSDWLTFGGGLPENVFALLVDTNGNLDAGTERGLAQWNGTAWSAVASFGEVYALTTDSSNNLYVAGIFDYVAEWTGDGWVTNETGNFGYALACDKSGNLYEGVFVHGDQAPGGIEKWDGAAWSPVGGGMSAGSAVYAIAFDPAGNLYVGGQFGAAGGVSANHIAKWDGTNWSPLGSGMNDDVSCLCCDSSGNVYAGGDFTTAGGVTVNYIAEWNGKTWSALDSGVDGEVSAITLDTSANLYVAGGFTHAGGIVASNVAKWNGHAWTALGPGVPGVDNANAVACYGSSELFAGGLAIISGNIKTNGVGELLLTSPTPNQLSIAKLGSSTNLITFLGTAGSDYALDLATNLQPPIHWMPQTTNTASSANAVAAGFVRFTNAATFPEGFYRARAVP